MIKIRLNQFWVKHSADYEQLNTHLNTHDSSVVAQTDSNIKKIKSADTINIPMLKLSNIEKASKYKCLKVNAIC